MKVKRPVVRYHGGKFLLADWIVSHFPDHRTYVESFGGGGSVLLKKKKSHFEVYNDLDGEIVNVFRVCRDHLERLRELIILTPYSRDEFVKSYIPTDDPIEQARRTIFRSYAAFGSTGISGKKTGFRGLGRQSGTVPSMDWANYPDAMQAISSRLRGVVIENRDAHQVMATYDSLSTLHYVDPPYVHSTRNKHCAGQGYRYEMTEQQHLELLHFIMSLSGMVVISGYDHPIYREILTDWKVLERRSMADGAKERKELLFISPNIRMNKTLFDKTSEQ